ncbi:ecotin [Escherichia coli]|uniref:Ecotin n=1 Tax=Escherichia coli TaxID=562 RepID=A0A376RGI3_ECOLX|nr:ecotin [Escherichia coli]
MKTILPAVLFAAFATTSAWAAESVQPLEKIAPYPQAEKGMKRQVIQLTPQEDESTLKVETVNRSDAGSRLQFASSRREAGKQNAGRLGL